MKFDFLFVPSSDDACLVPTDSCDICARNKLQYWKRWIDIPQNEITDMVRHDIKIYRVKCECKSR